RSDGKRKLIEFRPEIWQALVLLARDSGKSLEALADEAFTELLRRHNRPLSLKEALRESARRLPANDDVPQGKRRSWRPSLGPHSSRPANRRGNGSGLTSRTTNVCTS